MCAESGGLPERIRPGGEFGQAALMGLDKDVVDPVADGVVQQALQKGHFGAFYVDLEDTDVGIEARRVGIEIDPAIEGHGVVAVTCGGVARRGDGICADICAQIDADLPLRRFHCGVERSLDNRLSRRLPLAGIAPSPGTRKLA